MDPNGESLIINSQIKVVSSLVGSRVIFQYNNSIFCDASSHIYGSNLTFLSHRHNIRLYVTKKKLVYTSLFKKTWL